MLQTGHVVGIALRAALVATLSQPALADGAAHRFYKAYYLEHAEEDWRGAATLYERVADDAGASPSMRDEARGRLAAIREQRVAADLARLMPSNPLAYLELNEPGERVLSLLEQLGLSSAVDDIGASHRARVSPRLIREALGIGGVAVALTGFDVQREMPQGVLVFDHGNLELLRGVIETGLPVAATPQEAVGGFPTYLVEGVVHVALTRDLVVASTQREELVAAIERATGRASRSLVDNEAFVESAARRDDSLLYFSIDAASVVPLVKSAMAAEGVSAREMALIDTLVDLDSLRSLSGRLAVGERGLALDVELRLAEGHRSIVFDLARSPAVDRAALESVPAGVAAFVVAALNDVASQYQAARVSGEPVVSLLDVGREVFANITSVAVFAMPPGQRTQGAPVLPGGVPVPDVAAVLSVHDAEQSRALWSLALGLVSMGSGAGPLPGGSRGIEGERIELPQGSAVEYVLPEGLRVCLLADGNDVMIGTRGGVAAAVRAKRNKQSVLQDAAFADCLADVGAATTKLAVAHVGRCAKLARPFLPPHDLAEAGPWLATLDDTIAAVQVEHSRRAFRIGAHITGMPDVGALVGRELARHRARHQTQRQVSGAIRRGAWREARDAIEAALQDRPGDAGLLRRKFDVAVEVGDRAAALAAADQLYESAKDDANALNNFAWALLTEARYGDAYTGTALRFSLRSNEISGRRWAYLDTLALAKFKSGEVDEAIELERRAIELAEGRGGDALTETLARFEAAKNAAALATQ